MQQPKPQSSKIRNRIVITFIAGIILILSFGLTVFYLSFQTTQDINLDHGISQITNSRDDSVIANDVAKITRISFLFLTLGSVLFIYLMFNMMFSITPALRRLTMAVRAVSDGNFNYRLKLPQHDEMGEIAIALNHALDIILEGERSLEKQKAGVEKVVEQRTRELKFEEGKFLSSINGLPLGFILTDDKGHILMLNPAMEKILKVHGVTVENLMDKISSKQSFLQKLLAKSQTVLKHGKVTSLQLTDDGRYLHSLFSPISLSDEKLGGVVILVEDVTEAKILERSKDEFFSIASHELRTPLTAIRGNSSLIEQFYKEQLKDPDLNTMVEDIHNSSIRLIGIVNDFLDASRLEQGRIGLKPQVMMIEGVIQSVMKQMSVVAEEKHLYVKTDTGQDKAALPPVFADPERVEQVLYNLIGNSLKFVTEGGVTIKTEHTDKLLKVYISDTGRGISVDNQQLLFHKFQQANTSLITRDTTRGTGLGLYISKLLTEKMGGNLRLEHSEEGKGSTFSFTLPLATAKDLPKNIETTPATQDTAARP